MLAGRKKYVLICDDEKDVRDLIRDAILHEFPDVGVVEAEDGSEAYFKAQKQVFDLLITDLRMPKKDGTQLLKAFDEWKPQLRPKAVLVFSAYLPTEYSRKSLNGVSYLEKPCKSEVLKNSIRQILFPSNSNASLPVEVVNPFIDATILVLAQTCETQASKERVFVRKSDQISGDISAVIGISASRIHGSMALTFQEGCFLGVVAKMLGETHETITSDISDAAGELCNQIFGWAKARINEQGYDIKPAIPSVIVGKDHLIKHITQGPVIAVQFRTNFGFFTIEAAIASKPET